MDGVHQSAVDQILSAIEHGNLGVDETERRLQELIQTEQAKPSAEQDQRLIDSAEQLREELHHRTALSFEAKRQQDLANTLLKYREWKKQQHKQRRVHRIGALATMILLCLGLGSGLLHWNWFKARATPHNAIKEKNGEQPTRKQLEALLNLFARQQQIKPSDRVCQRGSDLPMRAGYSLLQFAFASLGIVSFGIEAGASKPQKHVRLWHEPKISHARAA